MLTFEDSFSWSSELAAGLGDGEFEVTCPACETNQYVVLGDPGYFSTTGDYWSDTTVARSLLLPADPAELDSVARRLHDMALTDDRREVATTLTYVFGSARCSACGSTFTVADHRV
jgi:hypothetical protein